MQVRFGQKTVYHANAHASCDPVKASLGLFLTEGDKALSPIALKPESDQVLLELHKNGQLYARDGKGSAWVPTRIDAAALRPLMNALKTAHNPELWKAVQVNPWLNLMRKQVDVPTLKAAFPAVTFESRLGDSAFTDFGEVFARFDQAVKNTTPSQEEPA